MPNVRLDRNTLQKFLPSHEAIVAFEKMFDFVSDIGPEGLLDLLALVNSIKRVNVAAIDARISELEAATGSRAPTFPQSGRLDDIEAMLIRKTDLSGVLARIEALEQTARRRDSNTALIQRIENLEKMIGV
jgi:hypothetical protein